MAPTLDPHATEAKARELLDKRVHSVRALVTARQTVTDLTEQLDAAHRADYTAYHAALRDGWTADELKQLGLPEPATKPRPKRPIRTATPNP